MIKCCFEDDPDYPCWHPGLSVEVGNCDCDHKLCTHYPTLHHPEGDKTREPLPAHHGCNAAESCSHPRNRERQRRAWRAAMDAGAGKPGVRERPITEHELDVRQLYQAKRQKTGEENAYTMCKWCPEAVYAKGFCFSCYRHDLRGTRPSEATIKARWRDWENHQRVVDAFEDDAELKRRNALREKQMKENRRWRGWFEANA